MRLKVGVSFGNIVAATHDIDALQSATSPANPHDTMPADVKNALAIQSRFDDSAACQLPMPGPTLDPIELPVGPEFSIAVPVAGFSEPRQLGSSVLFGKVNDLLERGLIMRGLGARRNKIGQKPAVRNCRHDDFLLVDQKCCAEIF